MGHNRPPRHPRGIILPAAFLTEMPLIDGDIAFRQHSGGRTTGPNWPAFLLFASRYMN